MKNKVPISQFVLGTVLIFLLILRGITENDISVVVSCVNYIGMVVGLASDWVNVITKSQKGRKRNICTSFLVLVLMVLTIVGCCGIFIWGMSPRVNDIVTLFALLFCVCNTIVEKIISKIFAMSPKS